LPRKVLEPGHRDLKYLNTNWTRRREKKRTYLQNRMGGKDDLATLYIKKAVVNTLGPYKVDKRQGKKKNEKTIILESD